ncbi:uncharacterized protein CPUR_07594 [Claviceps purpurea 20.1]|uniref:Uncharacterized protein n=1 Tax=Claviceps purpurea (strain 20.1) TaxID=1111077 RepID=M1WFH8_CLAP2|nr:uncharacterized protein CPUR_07594 [Claviceps purpurea 20.1]
MLKGANLPEELSPESTKAAAYLYNMSPKQRLAWRTPKSVINEWHLDTYGYGIMHNGTTGPHTRLEHIHEDTLAISSDTKHPTYTEFGYQSWRNEALQARTLDDIAKDIEISEQTSAIDQLTQIVSLAFPEENETIALPFNPTSVDILRAGRETSEPPSPTVSFEDSDSESDTPAPNIGLLTPEATPPPDEDNHASIHTPSDSDAQHMSTNDPPLQGTERHSNTEEQGADSTSSSSIVPQGHETLTEHTFSGHTF